jgi:cytochrome P450
VSTNPKLSPRVGRSEPSLSLYHLLDPDILANPYPLYRRLQTEDPVHWDPYLHAWVVSRYADAVRVLQRFSAARTPTPEQLTALGLSELNPVARVLLVRQMLFMDPPAHTRLRALAAAAFTPSRAEALRSHIQEITDDLIDAVLQSEVAPSRQWVGGLGEGGWETAWGSPQATQVVRDWQQRRTAAHF